MIQHRTFDPGKGYVLHKVTGYWSGRCSAWYDQDGRMLDAERYDRSDRAMPVRQGSPLWNELQRIGRWFVNNP